MSIDKSVLNIASSSNIIPDENNENYAQVIQN